MLQNLLLIGAALLLVLLNGFFVAAEFALVKLRHTQAATLAESLEEMIPSEMLGKLPNLQYFASVSGGRIIKGRFPILIPPVPDQRQAA